jgi:1L-myo-inositol 1-phosphate cytidylyltransferase / CDP-L-myo-inositol myo-inositolphosphotransferase
VTGHVVLAATAAQQPGASLRVGGLTVLERAIRQLARTPDARVIVASDGSIPLPPALPPNVEVRAVPDPAAAAVLAGDLGAQAVEGDVVRVGGGSDEEIRVIDDASRRAAEDAVFATLFRPDLGFVARRLNKPISVPLTRHLLVRSSITPNQITLVAAAFGVFGCLAVATGRYGWVVAGFVMAQIQSVLDGCDGELARVRFQQSKMGAWLDTFVDDVLNVLMTGAAGIGLYRAGGGDWAMAIGVGGAAMLIASNLIIMRDMRRQRASGDLMDMIWWFSGGRKLSQLPAGDGRPGIGTILFQMGRRDTAIFLWLIFALANQLVLVVVMATIIALAWFVAAVIQLAVAPPAGAQ